MAYRTAHGFKKVCRILIPAVLFLAGCGEETEDKGVKVALAHGKVLYEDDLRDLIPEELANDETAREDAINEWIRQQILLHKARTELSGVEDRIRGQVERYRANLIMYEYERYVIEQQLDTNVSNQEIRTYYDENIDDFELDDYLVQALFIKARRDANDVDKVNIWFRSNDSTDIAKMQAWSSDEAVKFYYDNESWLYFEDVKKMLPAEMIYNEQNFIVNKLARKYEDEEFVYFFRVLDFRTGVSPLEFETQNIRSRIIQVRIAQLRDKLRKEIINETYSSSDIERF